MTIIGKTFAHVSGAQIRVVSEQLAQNAIVGIAVEVTVAPTGGHPLFKVGDQFAWHIPVDWQERIDWYAAFAAEWTQV